MVREIAISIYLFIFRLFFYTFRLFPQKEKTTFVTSFGDNIFYVLKEVEKQTNDQMIILQTPQCKFNFDIIDSHHKILNFGTYHFIDWFRSIYHLATSKKVFVDNYYGFLAVTDFKPNVTCIQLWHAAGAIKQFGLKDPSNKLRSQRANQRFQKVYSRFNYVVVGSEKMANIFRESFNLSNDQILRSGIPRTDLFFNPENLKQLETELKLKYPIINNKKVILYAPTFRDGELNNSSIKLNIESMYQELKEDYVLFLRLHPAMNVTFNNKYPDFIIDVSNYVNINELLVITDILITDYSSIPFEFSLLNRPILFYAYDLEEYSQSRGFWEDYEHMVPGPVLKTTDELIYKIQNNEFDLDLISSFAKLWNQYSLGYSSKRLVELIYSDDEALEAVDHG